MQLLDSGTAEHTEELQPTGQSMEEPQFAYPMLSAARKHVIELKVVGAGLAITPALVPVSRTC